MNFNATQSGITFAVLFAPCSLGSTRQGFSTNSKHTLHASTAHVVTSTLRVNRLASMTLAVVFVTIFSLSAIPVLCARLKTEIAFRVKVSCIALFSNISTVWHAQIRSRYRIYNRGTNRTYILQSWIFFSVVVRGRFIRVHRIYAEYPAIYNTVRDFYRSQDKNHKEHESFHDDRLAIHAQLWQSWG